MHVRKQPQNCATTENPTAGTLHPNKLHRASNSVVGLLRRCIYVMAQEGVSIARPQATVCMQAGRLSCAWRMHSAHLPDDMVPAGRSLWAHPGSRRECACNGRAEAIFLAALACSSPLAAYRETGAQQKPTAIWPCQTSDKDTVRYADDLPSAIRTCNASLLHKEKDSS